MIANAVEQEIVRINEREDDLKRTVSRLTGEIEYLRDQMLQASKQYGIEATTQMQYIINDLIVQKNTAIGQLKALQFDKKTREKLRDQFEEQLDEMLLVHKDFSAYTDQKLQKVAIELFERIKLRRGYEIAFHLSSQIRRFLPLVSDMVDLENPSHGR